MVLMVLEVILVFLRVVLVVLGVVLRQCSEQMFGTDSVRNNVPSQLSRWGELLGTPLPVGGELFSHGVYGQASE